MTIILHELINGIILHELINGIIVHEIINNISGLTEVENGQIAADDAATDRLALALAGAAGAVAVRRGLARLGILTILGCREGLRGGPPPHDEPQKASHRPV